MKSINEANLAKRILAMIMDAAVMLFIMFSFIAFMFIPIANKGLHYSERTATGLRYQVATKLYLCVEEKDDGQVYYDIKDLSNAGSDANYIMITEYEKADEEFYKSHIKYYYLNYKTGLNIETPENGKVEDFRAPNFEEKIDNKLPSELYTEEWFNEKFGSISDLDGWKEAALDAMKDFYYQDYFIKLNKDLKWIQGFIIFPPFVISFSIFFIVIPLCFKNGETLGKKVMHIALVTKDGYQVQKRQIVFRQILLLLYVSLSSFVVGIGLTSIATLGIGVFIYYLATFISKTKRSPFDYLAYVMEVDTIHSVWFKSKFEEDEKEKELECNLKEYRKVQPDNKHVIQVGDQIVDEKIKQEVLEEKTENNEK